MKDLGYFHVNVLVDDSDGLVFEFSNPSSITKIEDLKKTIEEKFKRKKEKNARLLLSEEWHAERLEFTIS